MQPSINYFYAQYYEWTASYLVRGLARTHHWLVDPDHIRVPDPTFEIMSELNTYVTSRGARFIVGLQDENAELTRYLNEERIDQLELKNPHRYPAFGTHWTPAGHKEVSRRFLEYLSNGEYLRRTTKAEGHLQ